MAHKLVVLEWLYKADQDFKFAEKNLKSNAPFYDQICFFFHQSAEKYLKAYIVKHNLKFEKQHDLVKLLKICRKHKSKLVALHNSCQFLTPFYFETRYPDTGFKPSTKDQAKQAYQYTMNIQKLIKRCLDINRGITYKDIEEENKKIDKKLKKM